MASVNLLTFSLCSDVVGKIHKPGVSNLCFYNHNFMNTNNGENLESET